MLTYLFTKTPLFFLTQSLWRDEAFSYFMAKKNIFQIIFLTAKDFNPPLYYFILHFWIKIFGGSEIALRSLSIIFFWATIYVAFLFLNEIFKIKLKKSFFYLFFFIINPLLLYYSFEARMYAMLAFLATLSFYTFFKKDYYLYFFSTVLGLFTHYYMIFVVASQLIFIFINKKRDFNFKLSIIYKSLLVFSPWFIFFLLQKNLASFWLTKPHLKNVFGLLGIIYTGNESFSYANSILYLSLLLLVITGIYLYLKELSKKERLTFQLLFIWGIGIALFIGLISFIKPLYLSRYLIFATVGLLLLMIFILEKINISFRVTLIAILILFTCSYQKLQINYRKKADLRKTLREIKAFANKNDLVYVTSDLDFFTVKYYFDENKVYIYGKSYEEIPSYVGKALIPKEKITQTLPFYPQKAFVLTPDGQYTIQAMY